MIQIFVALEAAALDSLAGSNGRSSGGAIAPSACTTTSASASS